MFTIRRTRSRRYPIVLRSEHEDRGPYYLVDLAGFGVSFRERHQPRAFEKAMTAFEMLELDDEITPKEAKAAVDHVFKYGYATHAARFWDAVNEVDRMRKRAKRGK